jgi:hypothetical protein
MDDYNDDDIGELDEEVQGVIDIKHYDNILDEFLEENKHESYSSVNNDEDINAEVCVIEIVIMIT